MTMQLIHLALSLLQGRNFTQDEIVVTNDNDQRANVTIVTQALLNELFSLMKRA